MIGNTPNNRLGNATEKIAPDRSKSEEFSEKFDTDSMRESQERGELNKFEKTQSENASFVESALVSALHDDNDDHLTRSLNDVDREKREKIQELINIVFEKSLAEGIAEAKKLKDPYLTDELLKILTTEWMHKELVKRGLLTEPK